MSAQFDFDPGFDLSSVASVTQIQLQQAFSQIAPILNIGGVIFQARTDGLDTAVTQGTNGAPDVTNNPRFSRYMWLDTSHAASAQPTPYFYAPAGANAGKWVPFSVAAGSITNTEISAAAAIAVSKLATGTARYLLRTNAAGTSVEYVAPGSAFQAAELAANYITPAGSNSYLKTVGGVSSWVDEATERAAILASISALAVSVLQAGTNGYILTTIAGVATWAAPATAIPAGSLIPLAALTPAGTNAKSVLVSNGVSWQIGGQGLLTITNTTIGTSGILVTSPAADLSANGYTQAHGLTVIPKLTRVVAVKLAADATSTASASYSVGDEVGIDAFSVSASSFPAYSVSADVTNIYIGFRLAVFAAPKIISKLGTVNAGDIDPTKWQFKVYAWI